MSSNFRNRPSDSPAGSRIYLVLLLIVFSGVTGLMAVYGDASVLHDPLNLVLVGLAAFRGGRAIAFNYIFSWLRAPFTQVVNDSSGAGKSVEACGRGLRRVLGELLCCPTCAGTWVGITLAGLMAVYYPLGLALAFVLAASGIGEVLHWRAERDEWQGRAAREEAGTAWLWKNKAGETRVSHSDGIELDALEARYEKETSSLV